MAVPCPSQKTYEMSFVTCEDFRDFTDYWMKISVNAGQVSLDRWLLSLVRSGQVYSLGN